MPIPRSRLRLTPDELDEVMAATREVHVATVSPDGSPHISPLWFAWHDGTLWVNSLIRSRRTRDIAEGSPVAVCADTGDHYGELRGAILRGRFVEAADDPRLPAAQAAYATRYWGGSDVPPTRSHVWLRLEVERVDSWDFRKIPAGRDVRLEAQRSHEHDASS